MSDPDLTPELGGSVTAHTDGSATLIAERIGSGPEVFLLVHGLGMGRSVFADLARRLSSEADDGAVPGGTVLAVDLPGFGAAPEPDLPLTMAEHAALLASSLDAAGVRPVTVIGHSMGSQIAAELATRYPDRVRAVVLAAPTVDAGARRVSRQILRFLRDTASVNPRVMIRGVRELLRAGPHLVRKVRATVNHDPEDLYPRISAPVLILRGEHDPVCPRIWCRTVADAIPGSEFAELTGSGHETMIRDAGPAASRIREFLSRI
ncbi:alpha/beta hydrolase [Microbacterium panaciterrae]|uniref:Alpha/beta hydrolase n=1 Tax=Microbacterium panaciterrae TaxID=985759 RepID=A0ABP8PMY5_9MICO